MGEEIVTKVKSTCGWTSYVGDFDFDLQIESRLPEKPIADIVQDHTVERNCHECTQDILHQVLQRRGVVTSVRAPFIPPGGSSSSEPRELRELVQKREDFTKLIFGRLFRRGVHGLRTMRVMLHNMDWEQKGFIQGKPFEGALVHLGIRLEASEYKQMIELFGIESDLPDCIDYVRLLASGRGCWNELRLSVVEEAYDTLLRISPGRKLTIDAIAKQFDPTSLTPALSPLVTEHNAHEEFLKQWSDGVLSADGVITFVDFLDYYLDVSWYFGSNPDFCKFVCNMWRIDLDDWFAKRCFRKHCILDQNGEEMLTEECFQQMLEGLDETINPSEVDLCYQAIDENGNGRVDWDEFVASKVLKAKRLFDYYDTARRGSLNETQMVSLLKDLSHVSDAEATTLFKYADLHGSGRISFLEFLRNHVLRVLKVFGAFDRNHAGSLLEAQLKSLLKKADPLLDDFTFREVYKAIDTDGRGSISFAAFCESQVLRVKDLFDRHDTDRNKMLTQVKLRELLLDLDPRMTQKEIDIISSLVTDTRTQQVHLSGLLNPNIVRLKLVFDKHDKDRKRRLSSQQLSEMLVEIFPANNSKDSDALMREYFNGDALAQGLPFTTFVSSFKELARKNDEMQLAKRRMLKKKAESKGLVFR